MSDETTTKPMSAQQFAVKVGEEGGVWEALDYGLTHKDIDPDDLDAPGLRYQWKRLEELHAEMAPLINEVEDILVSKGADI